MGGVGISIDKCISAVFVTHLKKETVKQFIFVDISLVVYIYNLGVFSIELGVSEVDS